MCYCLCETVTCESKHAFSQVMELWMPQTICCAVLSFNVTQFSVESELLEHLSLVLSLGCVSNLLSGSDAKTEMA